ncbi:hypothetical protein BDN70DRAFT_917557 [Pholiota conissans]|uniref:F-box domain-containing protein n=1 Tax=Pholiota conissans TaxID=109636 RepID=A0A9P5ZDN6_9AGAR|nr:hypothetical protein BDN70DRAFT_917557 [Pholiota conissans]
MNVVNGADEILKLKGRRHTSTNADIVINTAVNREVSKHLLLGGSDKSNPPPISHFPNTTPDKARQISHIDAEVLRTEDAIVALVKKRALLKRKRNTFVPAVNLPSELLAMIFEYACSPSPDDESGVADVQERCELCPGDANFGIFIGAVCSAWRSIAKGASQLWSTVNMRVSNKQAGRQAALLRYWLSNSGQRPLKVRLIEDDENDNEENEDDWGINTTSTAVINVLAGHAQQLQFVDLFLPSAWKQTLNRISRNLPLLTHLTLRVADGSPSLPRVDYFVSAPQLREVTLVGYSVADVSLPWAQLERLDGEYFSAFECLETLRLCPRLRRCTLEQLYRGIFPMAPVPMTHTALEALELLVDTPTELGALLGALTLPALRSFVLSLPDEEPLIPKVLPLIARSACALETLHLVGVTPPEDELVACLGMLPGLRELLLLNPETERGGKLTQKVLDLMNPGKQEGREWDVWQPEKDMVAAWCLVPNLEAIVYQGAVSFTPHALVEFLANRWYGTSLNSKVHDPKISSPAVRLRSATFTTTIQIRFEGTDALVVQKLMQEGMHLEFLVG